MASAENTLQLTSSGGNTGFIYVYFNETGTNVSTNKSTLAVYGSLTMTRGAFSVSSNPTLYLYWHNNPTNTDTLVASKSINSLSSGQYSDISGNIDVDHNSDGTGSGYAYAVWDYSGSNAYVPRGGTCYTTNTALTTISRASIPTATNGIIGSSITINTNRTSSDFTHTITYSFGSQSGTIANNVAESVGFTIPTSFYNELGSTEKSKTMTISCTTYKDSQQIGTTQTTTCTISCDETECQPTFDFTLALTDGTATSSLTGNTNTIIAGYTESELQYTATAKHGATIDRVYLANYDTSYSSSPINLHTEISDNALRLVGGINAICYDSRNIGKPLTKNYTIIEYFEPRVDMTPRRTSPTGSEVKILFNGSFFNGSFGSVSNTLTISWKYRIKGASSWTTDGTLTNNTHYKISGNNFYSGTGSTASEITLSSSVFTYTNSYEIQLVINDELNQFKVEKSIAKGKPIFWWNENGVYNGNNSKFATIDDIYPVNSIIKTSTATNPSTTLGGTWTEIECNDIIASGNVTQSTNLPINYGKYRLYANGDIEAWLFLTAFNVSALSDAYTDITLPFTPIEGVAVTSFAYGDANWPYSRTYSYLNGNTGQIRFYVYNTSNAISYNVQPNLYFKGKVDMSGIATIHSWKRTG